MELGTQDQLRMIMNSSDVLVCTSKAGGFEMSITEAMACGKPALVTDWTFMNEIVDSYEDGFLIPTSNRCGDTTTLYNGKRWGVPFGRVWGEISINVLADAMRFCVEDKDTVIGMGKQALSKAITKYNWVQIAGKLYKEIMR